MTSTKSATVEQDLKGTADSVSKQLYGLESKSASKQQRRNGAGQHVSGAPEDVLEFSLLQHTGWMC